MNGSKQMRVPSTLVDCSECGATFEIDNRTFNLAVERSSEAPVSWRCDECRVKPMEDREPLKRGDKL